MMATGKEFEVIEVGVFTPKTELVDELTVGDVGFLSAAIKHVGIHVLGIPLQMRKMVQLSHFLVTVN